MYAHQIYDFVAASLFFSLVAISIILLNVNFCHRIVSVIFGTNLYRTAKMIHQKLVFIGKNVLHAVGEDLIISLSSGCSGFYERHSSIAA